MATQENRLLVWQLVDSLLPTGGFAHSMGLEACSTNGLCSMIGLETLLSNMIQTIASQDLVFLVVVHLISRLTSKNRRAYLKQVTEEYSVRLTNPVARRASIAQGTSLARILPSLLPTDGDSNGLLDLRAVVDEDTSAPFYPLILGFLCGMAKIDLTEACEIYLFTASRDILSAAVRLSLVGPLKSVELQSELRKQVARLSREMIAKVAPALSFLDDDELSEMNGRSAIKELLSEAHSSFPLLDILQGTHDKLQYKLFNT